MMRHPRCIEALHEESMRILRGIVDKGHGYRVASANLAPVMGLIESRMGLASLVAGTLNVRISEEYIVCPHAIISPEEYPLNKVHGTNEMIKLQRCLIRGHKAVIMRPDTHETLGWARGKKGLELMGTVNFRDALGIPIDSVVEVEVEVEGDDAWWASGT
jgi:CTP-dependent riboflavin kinase